MARRALLAAGLAFSVSAIALGASATRSKTVLVGDDTLKPASVSVPVGGSVTWHDAGKRQHRITSDTKAFAAFSLRPSKSHAVRFKRSGRYRYHIDGKRKGLVVVVAASGNGGSGPTGPSGAGVKWSGSMSSDTSRTYPPGAGSCTDAWSTRFTFTVAANGSVAGSGTGKLVAGPTCTKITHIDPVTQVNVLVSGSADAKVFHLEFRENGVSPPVPALLYAGYLSVFVSDITDPTSSPALLVRKQEPCSAVTDSDTSLKLPTGDLLVSTNKLVLGCA